VAHSGYQAGTDHYSLTVVNLMHEPDGKAQLKSLLGKPVTAEMIARDAFAAAGITLDEVGNPAGAVTPAQQAKLDLYNKSAGLTSDWVGSTAPTVPSSRDSWWREDTNTWPQGFNPGSDRGVSGRVLGTTSMMAKTPLDDLRDMREERFAPLYGAIQPNSATVAPRAPEQIGQQINPGTGFTLPTIKPGTLPGPTGLPTGATIGTGYTSPTGTTSGTGYNPKPPTRPTYSRNGPVAL
jgi:hypothetical protein